MLKLPDCAKGPLEALAGVPQVAHDESVLPAALHRPWTPEVGRRGRPVVHSPKSGQIGKSVRENRLILWRSFFWQNIQMPKFMRGNDDAGETTSVLHDRHTVHLLDKV